MEAVDSLSGVAVTRPRYECGVFR